MRTKNTTGNGHFHSELPIVVYQISLNESEEFERKLECLKSRNHKSCLKVYKSPHTGPIFSCCNVSPQMNTPLLELC